MTDLSAKLDEMLAGLEGVTPGPWELQNEIDGPETMTRIRFGGASLATTAPQCGRMHHRSEMGANAAHIARCDPDTMRQIITLAQQALRTTEAGEVEREAVAIGEAAAFAYAKTGGGPCGVFLEGLRAYRQSLKAAQEGK